MNNQLLRIWAVEMGGSQLGNFLYGHQGLKKGLLVPTHPRWATCPLALSLGGGRVRQLEGMRGVDPLSEHHVKAESVCI